MYREAHIIPPLFSTLITTGFQVQVILSALPPSDLLGKPMGPASNVYECHISKSGNDRKGKIVTVSEGGE